MDEATYQRWWPLHIRAAKGQPLAAEEQSFYETGMRQLEAEERIGGTDLTELCARVGSLQAERAELLEQVRKLEQ